MQAKVRYVTVSAEYHKQRVDNFLLRELKGVSRTHVYKVLRSGQVRVNKGRVKPSSRLSVGDIVRIPPVMGVKDKLELSGDFSWLEQYILFEDESLIVVNKPSGFAVHGGSSINLGIIDAMRNLRPQQKFLELVHRLDKNTSGCLLIAKKRVVLTELQAKFKEHMVEKKYLALIKGRLKKRTLVEQPLLKEHLPSGDHQVKISPNGKPAKSIFNPIVYSSEHACTLVEVEIFTGRTHQIRVHANFLGQPVAMDTKYGDESWNATLQKLGLKRMLLHAKELRFELQDNFLQFTAELDYDGAYFLRLLGFSK